MLEELNERLADIQNGYTGNNNLKEKYSQHNWFKWLEALINETAG